MSFMSADSRDFIDSNVLVYAHSRASGDKRESANTIVDGLWDSKSGCMSIQVLQEFFVIVTTKLPERLSIMEAAEIVEAYSRWTIHSPEPGDLLAAIDIQKRYRISFWDAMIVHSAKRLGCGTIWTEDLSNGQIYAGVMVRNPFVNMVMEKSAPYGTRR